ncbi:MAG: ATP-binding protein [Bacteroidota bacterium]|nr:ATP-binding protein [Bacteroidota bacterium]
MKRMVNIHSKIDNLRVIENVIEEISTDFNLNSELYGNVLIATLEATNNAILHGNKLDEKKLVNIAFDLVDNNLIITVKDEGKGFNYSDIPDPTAPENLEKDSGRGIFLMEKLTDKLSFFDNGSIVELTFNLI